MLENFFILYYSLQSIFWGSRTSDFLFLRNNFNSKTSQYSDVHAYFPNLEQNQVPSSEL